MVFHRKAAALRGAHTPSRGAAFGLRAHRRVTERCPKPTFVGIGGCKIDVACGYETDDARKEERIPNGSENHSSPFIERIVMGWLRESYRKLYGIDEHLV